MIVWCERHWWIVLPAGLSLAAAVAVCGCMGRPQTALQPTETAQPIAAPEVTAGDNSHVLTRIEQRLEQVQNTLTVTNHALDERRATLASEKLRKDEKRFLSVCGVAVGVLVFGLVAPSPIPKRWHMLGYLASLGLVAGALALPFVLPW